MLKQIKIENFRCFKYFELNHLGRVNLLVGKNNSGKTSVLEAIQLLCLKTNEQSLKQILINRGEYFQEEDYFNVFHFFHGHEVKPGKVFIISGINGSKQESIKVVILDTSEKFQTNFQKLLELTTNKDNKVNDNKTKREINKIRDFIEQKIDEEYLQIERFLRSYSLSDKGIKFDEVYNSKLTSQRFAIYGDREKIDTKFIASSSLTPQESLNLFNQVVLTPEEDLVYEALRIIEPKIQRIAPIGTERNNNNSRGGFYVKLSDSEKRIPIGSMGDGIWRMLGLSLALVAAKDGVLLIDEIDTGLHYTALEDMWKLIWETAKKLNVQVFATTHSSDCWTALEVLANRDDVEEEDISIQRIEKDTPRSVVYNKKGIAVAAKREIEVR